MITFTRRCYGREHTLTLQDGCGMSWFELVGEFQDFLSGSGYVIPNKTRFDFQEILSTAFEQVYDDIT